MGRGLEALRFLGNQYILVPPSLKGRPLLKCLSYGSLFKGRFPTGLYSTKRLPPSSVHLTLFCCVEAYGLQNSDPICLQFGFRLHFKLCRAKKKQKTENKGSQKKGFPKKWKGVFFDKA